MVYGFCWLLFQIIEDIIVLTYLPTFVNTNEKGPFSKEEPF